MIHRCVLTDCLNDVEVMESVLPRGTHAVGSRRGRFLHGAHSPPHTYTPTGHHHTCCSEVVRAMAACRRPPDSDKFLFGEKAFAEGAGREGEVGLCLRHGLAAEDVVSVVGGGASHGHKVLCPAR